MKSKKLREFFCLLVAGMYGFIPSVSMADLSQDQINNVVSSCKEMIDVVENSGVSVDDLNLPQEQIEYLKFCQETLAKLGKLDRLEKDVDQKSASVAASRIENEKLSRENYELGLENFLSVLAEGTRWSTETDCDILVLLPDRTAVQLVPSGIMHEKTEVRRNGVLRVYANERNGLKRVIDSNFNTKDVSRFDFPLDAAKLGNDGNRPDETIVSGLQASVKSMSKHCNDYK